MKKFIICICLSMALCSGIHCEEKGCLEHEIWCVKFNEVFGDHAITNDAFVVEFFPMPPFPNNPDEKNNPLCFPVVACEVRGAGLEPNTMFHLYCPNTGCRQQPELLQECVTDEKGTLLFLAPGAKNPGIRQFVSIYQIPQFCSEWYLLSSTKTPEGFIRRKAILCYKPICIQGDNGQQMRLYKREAGGNLMEVQLSGFSPNEPFEFTSNSEGEVVKKRGTTDEKGCAHWLVAPAVKGKAKGGVTLTVKTEKTTLSCSCDWDTRTVDIVREQPPSCMKKSCPLNEVMKFSDL